MRLTSGQTHCGVRQRLPNLLAWLEETRPDVVCLQEIKVHDDRAGLAGAFH